MADTLISKSTQAVTIMNEVNQIINQQSDYMDRTEEIFELVKKGIDYSINGITRIFNMSDDMNVKRNMVTDSVRNLTVIAEKNVKNVKKASDSILIVSTEIEGISSEARTMKDIAKTLDDNMKKFKT